MFFSSSPTAKRQPSSTNQLNRYLPDLEPSENQHHEVLYCQLQTLEQTSKLIQIEKERFDQSIDAFNERINQCNNAVSKGKRDCSQMKDKIENIKFSYSFEQGQLFPLQQLPQIPFHSLKYQLNQKPSLNSPLEKEQINILSAQINSLEKQCARCYCDQDEKFWQLSKSLFAEMEGIQGKIAKNRPKSEQRLLQEKTVKEEQKLHSRIKYWESQLNHQFQNKILKLIQNIQTNQ